jgi:hypothetical protein
VWGCVIAVTQDHPHPRMNGIDFWISVLFLNGCSITVHWNQFTDEDLSEDPWYYVWRNFTTQIKIDWWTSKKKKLLYYMVVIWSWKSRYYVVFKVKKNKGKENSWPQASTILYV